MTGATGAMASPPRWPGPLSARVHQLCDQLGPQVGQRTAAGLREAARQLALPLQVAVAGRISSGKSTLVNALIGRRVAPTGAGGCTRLVTRFCYGTVDRVDVVCHTGQRWALPCDAGMIPAELGVDLAEVSHLEAYLTSAVLRDLTLVDTPGLGSPDDGQVSAAVAEAETVLYVVTQAVRADDAQALAPVSAATAAPQWGPVNAIAVLNKVDTVPPESVPGAEGDVSLAGALLAARQAEVLGPRVAEVIPMMGVLAETAETDGFAVADAEALAELARTDPATRAAMLLSTDLFTSLPAAVPAATRQRLLTRLDLYGVARALAALDADPQLTPDALRRMLREVSGLDRLQRGLTAVFRARADHLKAAGALASIIELAQACDDARDRIVVREAVEVLLARPEAHQLRMLEALGMVRSGAVPMPAELVDEVLRVAGGGTAAEQLGLVGRPQAELASYALARAGWWRSFAGLGATTSQSRVAYALHRAYFLLWRQLQDERGTHV